MNAPKVSERAIVTLVGAIQFVNILDFMMVMPLGPDFAKHLDISVCSAEHRSLGTTGRDRLTP